MTAGPERTLVVATHNRGKLEEFRRLLDGQVARLLCNADFGLPEPEETESSFVGNARIKARAGAQATGLATLADDSGLEVDALGGAPGIHTADWAEGPGGRNFRRAMERVFRELSERAASRPWCAQFRCALVLVRPDGRETVAEGLVRGQLIWPPRGAEGHGYDPMFVPDGHDLTFAEMDAAAKNRLSHRALAVRMLLAAGLD